MLVITGPRKEDMDIEDRGSGWWLTTIPVMTRSSGVVEDRTFRWRTEVVECCQRCIVSNGDSVPVWFGDYGELRTLGSQCGGCGSHYSATVYEVA